MDYQIILTKERGKWTAEVPALPGCVTWGTSKSEVLGLAREAIEGWLASREAVGKDVPRSQPTVELALVHV